MGGVHKHADDQTMGLFVLIDGRRREGGGREVEERAERECFSVWVS